jgi:peptide deformylase
VDICVHPHPVLRTKAPIVQEIDQELAERVRHMIELMYACRGVGLAATQVGWNARLCVINPTQDRSTELVCINPVLAEASGEDVAEEGCLSLPEVRGNVPRFAKVTCRWYDLEGHRMEVVAEGLLARIFQHEIDHLEGRLIIDRMTPASRLAVRGRLKELEREAKTEPRTTD